MTTTNTNYVRLKQQLTGAGYTPSIGPTFTPHDFSLYMMYLQAMYDTSNRMMPREEFISKALYGLEYYDQLPTKIMNNVTTGVQLHNADLWDTAKLVPLVSNKMQGVVTEPSLGFEIANGFGVQVGLSIRYANDPTLPVANNGVYTIPRLSAFNGNPWEYAFSIAALPNYTLPNYAVILTCSLDSTGLTTPVISYLLTGNTLVSTPTGTNSNLSNALGVGTSLVQNVENYTGTFIKSQLLPVSMQAQAVASGTYTITLSATGTSGSAIGDHASISIKAIVS